MKLLSKITNLIVVIYFIVAVLYVLIENNFPTGDELYFISFELEKINNIGLVESIKNQISIPFALLTYLPYIFFGLEGVKLTNLLLCFVFLYYTYHRTKSFKNIIFVMFYMATVLFFFKALNDTIFSLSLAVFFIESYYLLIEKKGNISLAFSFLIISFFTRSLILIYLPIILIILYKIIVSQQLKLKKLFIPLCLLAFFCLINIPSVSHTGSLSYDHKKPPEFATWSQRQYLSQIKVNSGEIESGTHVSWQDVKNYLEINGENSLPSTTLESIFFDLELTLKEFFKDTVLTIFYSVRQIGIVYILLISIIFMSIKYRKYNNLMNYKIAILFYSVFIFSLIIISNVELRWLAPAFLIVLTPFSIKKFSPKILCFNDVIIIFLACYGLFKLILRVVE